ncbi:hypothetical protein [Aeromicrobium sp. Leaf350]|uniref:hypothetical protein n=1 Tax=Aeromicrobium sp. Leaf350 TaxID=2876565 RepID=UPI001E4F19D2|nr:hypothetical protein [Aeromicrobium sp. Leaf350]
MTTDERRADSADDASPADAEAPQDSSAGMGRRVGVVTIDQAVSGGSNVLFALLAVQVLTPGQFGLFAIVFTTYVTVIGLARALVCDPLLVHPEEATARAGSAIGSAWVVGGVLGVLVALGGVAALSWDPVLAEALWVLAACLPLLIVQDAGRYLAFTTRRPARALVLDVAWLGIQIGALTVALLVGQRSLPVFVATWAVSGALAGIGSCLQNRVGSQRPGTRWLRETWGFSWRYLIAYGSTSGGALATSVAIGTLAGARALGGLQGALLLTRPFQTVQIAGIASGTAEISRVASERRSFAMTVALRVTGFALAAALVNGAVMVLLPDSLGTLVLSDTWYEAQPLLWAAAGQLVGMSLLTGPRAGLLGTRSVRTSLAYDIISTVVILTVVVIVTPIGGIVAGMWAVAITHSVGAAVLMALLAWRIRHPEAEVSTATAHQDEPVTQQGPTAD